MIEAQEKKVRPAPVLHALLADHRPY